VYANKNASPSMRRRGSTSLPRKSLPEGVLWE
jgi:hypothetical protein